MADFVFKKVTSTANDGTFTHTITDFIAEEHVLPYVLRQNSVGWNVTAIDEDDRPADADRSYNPPAYLTEGT
jgi:hypothetical protein